MMKRVDKNAYGLVSSCYVISDTVYVRILVLPSTHGMWCHIPILRVREDGVQGSYVHLPRTSNLAAQIGKAPVAWEHTFSFFKGKFRSFPKSHVYYWGTRPSFPDQTKWEWMRWWLLPNVSQLEMGTMALSWNWCPEGNRYQPQSNRNPEHLW